MALRRHHYERAFEAYLRSRRVPYIAVDEARRSLLPGGGGGGGGGRDGDAAGRGPDIKSFDFVVYGEGLNLLVDIKGRKVARPRSASGPAIGRLESWATEEDVHALLRWQELFGGGGGGAGGGGGGGGGGGFRAAFVFVYWCEEQPPDALFQEVFSHATDGVERWYALRTVMLDDYAAAMRPRSAKWGTVHLSGAAFDRLSHPFTLPRSAAAGTVTAGWGPATASMLGTGGAARPDWLLDADPGPDLPALIPLGPAAPLPRITR